MSESTNSEQYPAKSDSTSPAWFADWADFSMSTPHASDAQEISANAVEPVTPEEPDEEWNDWQTVNFPNAISADAIDRQSLYSESTPSSGGKKPATPSPTVRGSSSKGVIALPNWGRPKPPADRIQPIQFNPAHSTLPPSIPPGSVPAAADSPATGHPVDQPAMQQAELGQPEAALPTPVVPTPAMGNAQELAELMSLIQELNQCNSALIDRVSYLEDALDRSEAALQAEIARSQETEAALQVEIARSQEQRAIDPQELVAAHEQITQLANQLEFANQTQQRQQILVETLTTQLENSQERVAQLEREFAALQQHANEQAHALTQSENACRDVYARLHRQQRYTLQYKAALERCLEVPPPNYEAIAESGAAAVFHTVNDTHHLAPQSFLPKAQRIQPWSSGRSLTGKLEALVNLPIASPGDAASSGEPAFEPDDLDAAFMPDDVPAHSTEDGAIDSMLLSAAVQPLTDLSPEAIQVGLAELQSVLDDFLSGKSEAPTDAEIALWQDLARLIEVSTDDVVKANAAKDFESFTEPHSESRAESAESAAKLMDELTEGEPLTDLAEQKIPPASIPAQPTTLKLPMSDLPMSAIAAKIAAYMNAPRDSAAVPSQSGAPSPLVYPLRSSSKKLGSLAAVDLPTFPRGEG